LIINDLVINALKYAFPVESTHAVPPSNEISIIVVWENMEYTLTVADNGVGLPDQLDWQTTQTLGLRLVRMLGQHQLQGTLTLDQRGHSVHPDF
jgi:two-component sensor histidine kinase